MILVLRFLLSFSFDREDISNWLKTVFDFISKHLEARRKYSAARRIHPSKLKLTSYRFFFLTKDTQRSILIFCTSRIYLACFILLNLEAEI